MLLIKVDLFGPLNIFKEELYVFSRTLVSFLAEFKIDASTSNIDIRRRRIINLKIELKN